MGVGGLFEIKAYTASQLELELELAKKRMQQAVIYFCHTIQIEGPNKDHKTMGSLCCAF